MTPIERLERHPDYFPGCGFIDASSPLSGRTRVYFRCAHVRHVRYLPLDDALQYFPHLVCATNCATDPLQIMWYHTGLEDFGYSTILLPVTAKRLLLLEQAVVASPPPF